MSAARQLVRALVPRWARNWLRAPGKSLAWGWQELSFLFGRVDNVEIRPGWRVRCHPLAFPHAYHAQIDDPEQVREMDGFIALCTENMVLFDIGCHFGLFSLAALHYGGPGARAVAVDASPTAGRVTRAQALLNGLGDRLQVVQACVCAQPGFRDMVSVGVLADGYFAAPSAHHGSAELTHLPAVTLDQLIQQHSVRPTHVKIDVEGFEMEVLQGGEHLLSVSTPPVVFLELHNQLIRDRGEDSGTVLDFLTARGYSLKDPLGSSSSKEAFLGAPVVRLVAMPATHCAAPSPA
jgi:FkbM family methyltransferase